eukprot:2759112-Lingulodinium_polyedra.AAC.1
MQGQEAALRAERARALAALRAEHEETCRVLEGRIDTLERDAQFYLAELASYQERERIEGDQLFHIGSDVGDDADGEEDEEEEEEPEGAEGEDEWEAPFEEVVARRVARARARSLPPVSPPPSFGLSAA